MRRRTRFSSAERAAGCAAGGPRYSAVPSEPPDAPPEAPLNASEGLEPSPRDSAVASEPSHVQPEASPDVSEGLEPSPRYAAVPSEPLDAQPEASLNASEGVEPSPRDSAVASEPSHVQPEASPDVSEGLEPSPTYAAVPSEPLDAQPEASLDVLEGVEPSPRDSAETIEPPYAQLEARFRLRVAFGYVGTAQEEEDAFKDILEWEANVKEPASCPSAALQRFMDAAAQGGGTPAGTAKVITNGLMAQPEDVRPPWTKGRSEAEICEVVTQSICEAVEASYVVKDYMDAERAKGRNFDDIYSEVQPYLEYVSRPLDDVSASELVEARFREGPPTFQEQAARREAKRAAAPHRNLMAWPAAPRL
ncbi:unnamed protein product [Symbiodinium natans]|uniref:Uncharacterized protein n=1 Tax=Symbiodinium natans TaxID=878477 RepID=A0A812IL29_9DINO|nr:unnamed protein product [Symbiodinium natans]